MLRTLIRFGCVFVSLLLGLGRSGAAQIEIAPRFGVYFDRSNVPEWARVYQYTHLIGGDAWIANASSVVPVVGLRAYLGLHPRIGVEVEGLHSRSSATQYLLFNSALTPAQRVHDSTLVVSHLLVAARVAFLLTTPGHRLQTRVSLGPVLVVRHGTGVSLLDTQTEAGVSLVFRESYAIARRLVLSLDGTMDVYSAHYKKLQTYPGGVGTDFIHHDFIVLAGLGWSFGRVPGEGHSSGPGLVPKRSN